MAATPKASPKPPPKKKSSKLERPRDAIEALLEPANDRLDSTLVARLYKAFNRTFYEKTIAALKTPEEARRFATRIRANREFGPIRADLCREALDIVDKPKHRAPAMEIIPILFDGPPPPSGERLKGWGKQVWVCSVGDAMSKMREIGDLPLAVRLGDLVRPHRRQLANSYHLLELAEVYALAKRPADALALCREALARKFTRENLLAAPGLASLRSNPEFKALVAPKARRKAG